MIKLSEPVLTLLMCPGDFQPPAAELQQNLRVQRSVTLLVCYNICYGWRSKFMSDLFRAAQRVSLCRLRATGAPEGHFCCTGIIFFENFTPETC